MIAAVFIWWDLILMTLKIYPESAWERRPSGAGTVSEARPLGRAHNQRVEALPNGRASDTASDQLGAPRRSQGTTYL